MFKPMLSGKADLNALSYPLMVSAKLDGIRCLIRDGVALSRTLKPIPNKHVQRLLGRPELNGLDGEILVGSINAPDVYVKTNSGVMSIEGEPEFVYMVFDRWDMPGDAFADRFAAALPPAGFEGLVERLPHTYVETRNELDVEITEHVERGFEGTMLRAPDGRYKQGRSTTKEGLLLKVKHYDDAEAVIVGVQEEMRNDNTAVIDALGHTKRSSHLANKAGKGTMGALLVRAINGPFEGVEFAIGTGFTAADRAAEWKPGEYVKFKFMGHGAKDAPRHPVYLGRRSPIDMEAA